MCEPVVVAVATRAAPRDLEGFDDDSGASACESSVPADGEQESCEVLPRAA